MARKKKARLTHKKKSENKQTPDGPDERAFLGLAHEYGSFIMEDSDHEQHAFTKGDVAFIKYQESEDLDAMDPTEHHWIGKIREIRANSPDDVWVRVQWYWSPQEVAEVIKSFDPTICGKYEKLQSDNLDIISVHCFVGHVDLKAFDETSIYQVSIGEDEWFSRYNFLYVGKRISPKVTHVACSICKVPYTPGVEKILHFCPRPSCRTFYHQSCLIKRGYVEESRMRRVLETWPDIDRTESVEDLCGDCPPRKRQKKVHSTPRASHDPLADLPARLIAVAEQQIVRGIRGGGIVGNVTSVAAARQLIHKTLRGGDVVPDDWETMIDISAAFTDVDTLPNCICPSCYSPI